MTDKESGHALFVFPSLLRGRPSSIAREAGFLWKQRKQRSSNRRERGCFRISDYAKEKQKWARNITKEWEQAVIHRSAWLRCYGLRPALRRRQSVRVLLVERGWRSAASANAEALPSKSELSEYPAMWPHVSPARYRAARRDPRPIKRAATCRGVRSTRRHCGAKALAEATRLLHCREICWPSSAL